VALNFLDGLLDLYNFKIELIKIGGIRPDLQAEYTKKFSKFNIKLTFK